jgi:hypothetical protein
LKPGALWRGFTEQNARVENWVTQGTLYMLLYHSHNEKPYKQKVVIRNQASRAPDVQLTPERPAIGDERFQKIYDLILGESKVLAALVYPVTDFRFENGDVHFIYPPKEAWALELMKAPEKQKSLASVCEQVLGQPVRVHVERQSAKDLS